MHPSSHAEGGRGGEESSDGIPLQMERSELKPGSRFGLDPAGNGNKVLG